MLKKSHNACLLINEIKKVFILCALTVFMMHGACAEAKTITELIEKIGNDFGVDQVLIREVIRAESGFHPQAVSAVGARGLMQIMRPTWNWVCADLLRVDWDFDRCAFDPEKNIIVGTCFLQWINRYLDRNQGQLAAERTALLLACYNAGPGAVQRYGFTVPPYPETRKYVTAITAQLPAVPLVGH